MKPMNVAKRYGARAATAVATLALTAGTALAADPTSGVDAVTQLRAEMGDYGPAMFGLAIVAVGIGIGVKWIKRAKGAA